MNEKQDILTRILSNAPISNSLGLKDLSIELTASETQADFKKTERVVTREHLLYPLIEASDLADEHGRPAKQLIVNSIAEEARKKRWQILFSQLIEIQGHPFLIHHDTRGSRRWLRLDDRSVDSILRAVNRISYDKNKVVVIFPTGELVSVTRMIVRKQGIYLTSCSNPIKVGFNIHHSRFHI